VRRQFQDKKRSHIVGTLVLRSNIECLIILSIPTAVEIAVQLSDLLSFRISNEKPTSGST
jgi:hypothetical protein